MASAEVIFPGLTWVSGILTRDDEVGCVSSSAFALHMVLEESLHQLIALRFLELVGSQSCTTILLTQLNDDSGRQFVKQNPHIGPKA